MLRYSSFAGFRLSNFFVLTLLALLTATLSAPAGVQEDVTALLPRLAAAKVEDRYAAQMELQKLALDDSQPGSQAARLQLATVLAAKAVDATVEQPARVWIVRQLEYIGAAESVPALTTLLNGPDSELSECARRALEKNSARDATRSLAAALDKGGESSRRIGLIHSLGKRRDTESVPLLSRALDDPATLAAAALALATIADKRAVESLWTAYDHGNKTAADGLIAAANELTANSAKKRAAAICSTLYAKCSNSRLRGAALFGLAKADSGAAKPLIEDALSSNDPEMQSAGLSAAREVYGPHVSGALAALLPKLSPAAKILALRALDTSAEPQIISLSHDADEQVRLAAFERMGQVGGADSVPSLLDAAAGKNAAEQKTATPALAVLAGPGTDSAIRKSATEGNSQMRVAAIQALAARYDFASASMLIRFASDSDTAVSSAACGALAKLASDSEIDALARMTLAGNSPGAEAALKGAVERARDKSAAASKLVAAVRQAPPAQQMRLFDALSGLGGDEAFQIISSAASSSNDELKDAAIRAMADWSDYAATTPLLAIAADPGAKPLYNVLALQGVIRLVKASESEPVDARLETTLAAMKAARRDEERRLAISALASLPSAKSADALKPYLSNPECKTDAALAGITLAEALEKTDRTAATSLAQAIVDSNASDRAVRRARRLLRTN